MVSPVWSWTKNAWASASSSRKPSTYHTAPPGAVRGPPVRRSAARRFLAGGLEESAIVKCRMTTAECRSRSLAFGIRHWAFSYRHPRPDRGLDLVEDELSPFP